LNEKNINQKKKIFFKLFITFIISLCIIFILSINIGEITFGYPINKINHLKEDEYNVNFNDPPNTPRTPSGDERLSSCGTGSYSTSSTDPNNDRVQYRFDWNANGNHQYSSWTNLDYSGHTSSKTHSWCNSGTYVVKSQAKDEYGDTSSWSNGLTVIVTSGSSNNPPNMPNTPSGQTILEVDTFGNYKTSATDSGDEIQYRFDWDANRSHDYSDWTPLNYSGHEASKSHSWNNNGTYIIKAQAQDEHGVLSYWSNGLTVIINPKPNNAPNTPTIEGPITGKIGKNHSYDISTTDIDGDEIIYYIDWGDNNTYTTDYCISGDTITISHKWTEIGNKIIFNKI